MFRMLHSEILALPIIYALTLYHMAMIKHESFSRYLPINESVADIRFWRLELSVSVFSQRLPLPDNVFIWSFTHHGSSINSMLLLKSFCRYSRSCLGILCMCLYAAEGIFFYQSLFFIFSQLLFLASFMHLVHSMTVLTFLNGIPLATFSTISFRVSLDSF